MLCNKKAKWAILFCCHSEKDCSWLCINCRFIPKYSNNGSRFYYCQSKTIYVYSETPVQEKTREVRPQIGFVFGFTKSVHGISWEYNREFLWFLLPHACQFLLINIWRFNLKKVHCTCKVFNRLFPITVSAALRTKWVLYIPAILAGRHITSSGYLHST